MSAIYRGCGMIASKDGSWAPSKVVSGKFELEMNVSLGAVECGGECRGFVCGMGEVCPDEEFAALCSREISSGDF